MVLVVLLVLGAGIGFGASLVAGRQPAAGGVPQPVVARSPSHPVDPEPSYVADPAVPPLPTRLAMTRGRIGTRQFRYEFPVPRGWVATPSNANQTKWTDPANPPAFTYSLRVEVVAGLNQGIPRVLEDRIRDLDADEQDFELVRQGPDSLQFSYSAERHLRHGIVRWLDVSGSGFPEVEVAVSGRSIDVPGMEALMAAVTADLRRA